MARPLDGIGLLTYCRRLKLSKETQALLKSIRDSPPSRSPGAHRGNMPVWYPSQKMQCIIKAESHKVEFAFLLQVEHDDNVLEVWDQPPSIELEYQDRRGRTQRPLHTADYFLFRYKEAGWVECKPAQELVRQARTRPNRYQLDEQGRWRCLPGEAYAAKYGLFYEVYASDQINWAAQDNWLFLEDYHQHLDRLQVAEADLHLFAQIVREQPGILLSDLHLQAEGIHTDAINIAIVRHALYVDLATYWLSEPWRTPVFPSRSTARASVHQPDQPVVQATAAPRVAVIAGTQVSWAGQRWDISTVTATDITLANEKSDPFSLVRSAFDILVQERKIILPELPTASNFTQDGQELLDLARDVDLATAVFRNRVINPDHYRDDEQTQIMEQAASIPERTKRYWRQLYREAEEQHGSGLLVCFRTSLVVGANGRPMPLPENSFMRYLRLITIP